MICARHSRWKPDAAHSCIITDNDISSTVRQFLWLRLLSAVAAANPPRLVTIAETDRKFPTDSR